MPLPFGTACRTTQCRDCRWPLLEHNGSATHMRTESSSRLEATFMVRRWFVLGLIVFATGLTSGCVDRHAVMSTLPGPSIENVSTSVNPYNTLSVVVHFSAENADSARVLYTFDGGPYEATPFYSVLARTSAITVLGLKPRATYSYTVE